MLGSQVQVPVSAIPKVKAEGGLGEVGVGGVTTTSATENL
jgi:hypothetical protein